MVSATLLAGGLFALAVGVAFTRQPRLLFEFHFPPLSTREDGPTRLGNLLFRTQGALLLAVGAVGIAVGIVD
jgi:hypothetical protein